MHIKVDTSFALRRCTPIPHVRLKELSFCFLQLRQCSEPWNCPRLTIFRLSSLQSEITTSKCGYHPDQVMNQLVMEHEEGTNGHVLLTYLADLDENVDC